MLVRLFFHQPHACQILPDLRRRALRPTILPLFTRSKSDSFESRPTQESSKRKKRKESGLGKAGVPPKEEEAASVNNGVASEDSSDVAERPDIAAVTPQSRPAVSYSTRNAIYKAIPHVLSNEELHDGSSLSSHDVARRLLSHRGLRQVRRGWRAMGRARLAHYIEKYDALKIARKRMRLTDQTSSGSQRKAGLHNPLKANLSAAARDQFGSGDDKTPVQEISQHLTNNGARSISDYYKRDQSDVSQAKMIITDPAQKRSAVTPASQQTGRTSPLVPRRIRRVTAVFKDSEIEQIRASQLGIESIETKDTKPPRLCHGLDRVLFNPGVYYLQDPRSRVYNFDPYLEMIMPVREFDWDTVKPYVTSSKHELLTDTARKHGKKYVCSTSSSTGVLMHFHYLLSQWRPIEWKMLSNQFPLVSNNFTAFLRSPTCVNLRWRDGVYAIDADKEYDEPTVLSKLGNSMEKLLTLPANQFKKYGKSNPEQLSEEERNEPESYHFSTISNFLMRSQLDAYDPRLPGAGIFDLKTRAVVSIRMNSRTDPTPHTGYQIRHRQGEWESFEREYHDMVRSTMLKYSLQVRMGGMDGIFVAYHNVERIFGFQYLSLPEMDEPLHGQSDTALGDEEFKLSMGLLNEVLERVTAKYAKQSVRLHFETRDASTPFMYIFAEPMTEEELDAIDEKADAKRRAYDKTLSENPPVSRAHLDEKTSAEWQKLEEQVVNEMDNRNETSSQGSVIDGEGDGAIAQDPARDELITGIEHENDVESPKKTSLDEKTPQEISLEVDTADEKDILGLVLIIRNKVDGTYVERPTKFTSEQEWEVEYALKELKDSQKVFKACRGRRRKAVGNLTSSSWSGFTEMIRRITERGRRWREGQDEIDEKVGTKVYTPADGSAPVGVQPSLISQASISRPDTPETEVESYLDWLYKKNM